MSLDLVRRHLEEPFYTDDWLKGWSSATAPAPTDDPIADKATMLLYGWPQYFNGVAPRLYHDNFEDAFKTGKTFISLNIVKDGNPVSTGACPA